ncbi:MAG TPA: LCP family protein, partial [Thermomicrobiales bacterium]|nr:LCP family protein [Thermomicrobiales bacterium]
MTIRRQRQAQRAGRGGDGRSGSTARPALSVGLLGPALLGAPRGRAAAAARRGPHRGRRIGVTLLTLVLLVCAGAGIYAWQVTAALRDAEQAIVVPLPSEPRGSPVAAGTPAAPATSVAAASPAAAPTATAGSRLGLIGAVAGAATDGGDPGRDPIWQGKRYLNVLVLGFDSRDDDSGPPRSDVMLVAQLDLYAKTVNILSLPRDLWVTIPGHGEERVNAAYPFGWRSDQPAAGVALAKRTIEANFGIPIDYYISIDFRGFQKVV